MKAVVAHGADDLRVDDIATPEPGPNEVLIAMDGVASADRIFRIGKMEHPAPQFCESR